MAVGGYTADFYRVSGWMIKVVGSRVVSTNSAYHAIHTNQHLMKTSIPFPSNQALENPANPPSSNKCNSFTAPATPTKNAKPSAKSYSPTRSNPCASSWTPCQQWESSSVIRQTKHTVTSSWSCQTRLRLMCSRLMRLRRSRLCGRMRVCRLVLLGVESIS